MIIVLGQEPETVCYNYVATIHTTVHYAGKDPQHKLVALNAMVATDRQKQKETERQRQTQRQKQTRKIGTE